MTSDLVVSAIIIAAALLGSRSMQIAEHYVSDRVGELRSMVESFKELSEDERRDRNGAPPVVRFREEP